MVALSSNPAINSKISAFLAVLAGYVSGTFRARARRVASFGPGRGTWSPWAAWARRVPPVAQHWPRGSFRSASSKSQVKCLIRKGGLVGRRFRTA
jgi:hypothetical protein